MPFFIFSRCKAPHLPRALVPTSSNGGVSIRLYSGSLAGISSPVQNYAPMILADITVAPGRSAAFDIPASYNAFLYVIEGGASIGGELQPLHKDEVGWLNLPGGTGQSELKLTSGKEGVRLVLYAGQPTGDDIVSHGPFIGDTAEDIQRLYQQYRRGQLQHISTVPDSQRLFL